MPPILKQLIASKRFVAALGGLIFVLLRDRIPGITITEEQTVYVVSLIASWIVGDSIRGVSDTLLGSKRFVAAVGGVLFVLIRDRIPGIAITEEQTVYIVGLISSWIVGDSMRGIPKLPIDPSIPKV